MTDQKIKIKIILRKTRSRVSKYKKGRKGREGEERFIVMGKMIRMKRLGEADFLKVISLSLSIFKPEKGKEDPYHQLKKWKKNFKKEGLLIGAFVNDELAGYLFCYEKDSRQKVIHCWLAGTAEKYRRQGVFKRLMMELTRILKKRGYKGLTINTYPEKFPAMYAYLTKHGFRKYKEKKKDWQGREISKLFFKKRFD